MSLISFRSTNYMNAFILYAFVAAIVSHLAIEFRESLADEQSYLFKFLKPLTSEDGINNMHQLFYSIVITFVTTIFVYFVMYIIFGWGEGMLVNNCRR